VTICKACGKDFLPFRPLAQVCSVPCAKKHVSSQKKEEKQKLKARKEKAKPRSKWLKEAQSEFNRYIRLRDRGMPCISCGRDNESKQNAGHFLSTGARPELRFDERNVHKQCEHCNSYLSGNQAEYRIRLVERSGREVVEWLEGPHPSKKYTIDDLRQIKETYRAKAKALEGVTVAESACVTGNDDL
jgi:hypothetical protein